jgi:hypothetical protein
VEHRRWEIYFKRKELTYLMRVSGSSALRREHFINVERDFKLKGCEHVDGILFLEDRVRQRNIANNNINHTININITNSIQIC